MPSVSVRSSFVWKISSKNLLFLEQNHQKSNNVGVERGVAIRRAQIVWSMMTVTVTNFEGLKNLQKCVRNSHFSKLLPSEALKICHSKGHTI